MAESVQDELSEEELDRFADMLEGVQRRVLASRKIKDN